MGKRTIGIRHLARQRAVQLLYALEFAGPDEDPQEVERRFLAADILHRRGWGPFARTLARQTWQHRDDLDQVIRPTLKHWTLERLPIMDRICLRVALCELAYFPDIPLRVTINESIELARLFSNDEAPVYINAVLDTLARAFPHKDFKARPEKEDEAADEDEPRIDPEARLPEPPDIDPKTTKES